MRPLQRRAAGRRRTGATTNPNDVRGDDPGRRRRTSSRPGPPNRGQPTTFERDTRSVRSRRRSTPRPATSSGRCPGTTATASARLEGRATRRSSSGRSPCRRTTRACSSCAINNDRRRDGRQRDDERAAQRSGIGEGTVSETAGAGTNLADYDSKVECTRNGTVAVSVAGTKVDGAVAQGDIVVCTFTNTRKGTPPHRRRRPHRRHRRPRHRTPRRRCHRRRPARRRCSTSSSQRRSSPTIVIVGGRLTWTMTVTNRSSVAAADVNGVKLDDPRSFRKRLISLQAVAGHLQAVHLRSRAPRARSLGDRDRRHRGDAGRTSSSTSSASARRSSESNYRNNVAAALAQVIGPLTASDAVQTVCHTLIAEPERSAERARRRSCASRRGTGSGSRSPGCAVRARGAGVDRAGSTDRQGVARFSVHAGRLGLLVFIGRPGDARPARARAGHSSASSARRDTIVTG